MVATGKLFGKGLFLAAFNKEIDLLDDTINGTLHTSAFSPDQDAHDYVDDLANEITGAGYTAGGVQVANDTLTYTNGTNTLAYDGDDLVWSSATLTARTAVLADYTPGSNSARPLICYQQESADVASTAGEFRVAWNASGIFTIVIS